VAKPLVGPALVPILSFVLFFGPLPGWTIRYDAAGWVVQLVLLAIGALMVLPLVGLDEDASSLAVGLALAIGSFELVLDALPGVILRLRNGLATSWFDERTLHAWTPSALHDQRVAGAILWCVAEIIDLPFLVLVYRRWLRADARDAAQVDAILEAERAARRAMPESDAAADRDAPWWLTDPSMQQRLRGRD
jgi:cytochrome c oxidase assembly factor CtaG